MYKVIKLNRPVKYQDGLNMQKIAFELVKDNIFDGILFIMEHKPVFTIGNDGGWENMLHDKEYLESMGIDIAEIKRGGNVTFHGPGQIVAYPIFDLRKLKKDAHWYVDCLESVILKALQLFNVVGSKKPEYRGVWIKDEKIAAVGVSLKRWITSHGLALNVNVDKNFFDMINPCGIKEFGVSTLNDYTSEVDIDEVKDNMIKCFEKVFNIQLEEADETILERTENYV